MVRTEYTIVPLTKELSRFLPHKQEPFELIGRLIPYYNGDSWSVSERLFDVPREKTYQDDDFDPAEYLDNPEQAAFLAMLGGECVGSIRVCRRWNGGAFIEDLAIDRAHRGHGVGRRLMDAAVGWGREKGLAGVSLETQDDNLSACRFYMKYGFRLGGIDKRSYGEAYSGGAYSGEIALYFYLT